MSSLVDEALDRYVEWREDATAAAETYRRWTGAAPRERAWRFSVYMAALEQEESAAKSYAAVLAELDRLLRLRESRRAPGLPLVAGIATRWKAD